MRALAVLAAAASAHAAIYHISDTIIGKGFYEHFKFANISDPTHGRVRYVDQEVRIQFSQSVLQTLICVQDVARAQSDIRIPTHVHTACAR